MEPSAEQPHRPSAVAASPRGPREAVTAGGPNPIAFVAAVFPSEQFAAVAQIRLRRFQAREAGRLRLTPPAPGEADDRCVLSGPVNRDDLALVRTTVNMLEGRLVVVTT